MARRTAKREAGAEPPAAPPARPTRVWVTRARPAADATAARLKALGIEAIVEPLLEVRQLDADLELGDVCALAFTSANAVAAFTARSADRSLRVFAVGDATAAAARAARFASVLSAQGDVSALAKALTARKRELAGVILYPSAAETAQDLAAALSAVGFTVRQTQLYETVEAAPSETLYARLPQIDGVLLHSAKAARVLAGVLRSHPAPHLTAFCLSPQVAQPLARARLAGVVSADEPNEASLLERLAPPGGD